MSDVRSLLRQQRASRRIENPHASYSDAGKLLCTLCREAIKSDSLWDGHVKGQGHRTRLQELQALKAGRPTLPTGGDDLSGKRKHDDVDESMSDADDDGEAIRKKRSKPDMTLNGNGVERERANVGIPPSLARRTSNTPIQGVEISIPSRPATPSMNDSSATSTPMLQPAAGKSPFIGSDAGSGGQSSGTGHRAISTESLQVPKKTEGPQQPQGQSQSQPAQTGNSGVNGQNGQVDEDEWAAFEADIAASEEPAPVAIDATISAPAMTAAQIAEKSAEEEQERKKQLLDVQIADEREDATRALEDEFDEMEQLEGRVRKLKERREELRKGSVMNLRKAAESDASEPAKAKVTAGGKENDVANGGEEDESDEEDEDDWVGFRFKS